MELDWALLSHGTLTHGIISLNANDKTSFNWTNKKFAEKTEFSETYPLFVAAKKINFLPILL